MDNINMKSEILTESYKRKKILENWESNPVGKALLMNLDEKMKTNLAVLLENQRRELLKEASDLGDIKGWQNVALPIVRRFFPEQIAHQIVGVQPLTLPSGLVFYLDFTFNTSRGTFNSGESVYGGPVGANLSEYGAYASGSLYELNNAYSKYMAEMTGTAIDSTGAVHKEVDYDPSLAGKPVRSVTIRLADIGDSGTTTRGKKGDFDFSPNGVKQISAKITINGVEVRNLRLYNRYISSPTPSLILYFNTTGSLGSGSKFDLEMPCIASTVYSHGVNLTDPWQSSFTPIENPTPVIPEIDLSITSKTIVAEPRKLKAKWTPEIAQDLSAYHNIDGEVMVTKILSEFVSYEIDREILGDLLFCRNTVENSPYTRHAADFYWSRKVGEYLNMATGEPLTGTSWFGTRSEWYQTLLETVNAVSNMIFKKTLRGAANWIVTSTEIATILESTNLMKLDLMDSSLYRKRIGVEKFGTFAGKYQVFIDPYFPSNVMLIGYNGQDFFDTGYVYAPYIPLIMTPTIFAPEDFTPRKGLMTRYGRYFIRPDFYGKVTIKDLY